MTLHKLFFVLLMSSLLLLPGCDIIVGIFQAGFWTAIFIVAALVALITFAIFKFRD